METADEVSVCQTCGAEGFTNAFIHCVKCLGFVIHRYCLAAIPKTDDEFVKWYCDDCKPLLAYRLTPPPKHDPSQSQNKEPPNSAPLKKTPRKKKPKKKSLKKKKLDFLVKAGEENGCVSGPDKVIRCLVLGLAKSEQKSLQLQEKVATSLQQETPKSNCEKGVKTPPISPLKEALVNSDSGANQITLESAELENNRFPMKGIVKRKRDTIRVAVKKKKLKTDKSSGHSSCESSCTDATLKNDDGITQTEEGLNCGPDHDKLVSNSSFEKALNNSKEFSGNAYASQSAYLENNLQNIDIQPARPVLDPVWRGSFNITQTDYDLFEGFVGHLSNKACKKVFEEATALSSMLSLEMHAKAHLWPKSFLHSMSSDESIALYFFPGDTRNERDFEQLVNDMIDQDLAMKAIAKNAELLIFTSKLLPQSYWRFQGNYYLWGVFRGKKNDVPVANHSDNNVLSANFQSEKESVKRVKTIESHSPQSPLCSYR